MEWLSLILLLLAGIVLIVIEIIFIPGTTILGIIGVALVVFGVIIGYSKFGPQAGTIVLISTVAVGGTVTVLSFRSGIWKKFALNSINKSKFNEDIKIEHLLGAEGVTLSACRPFGKAEIYEATYEVTTLGMYLTAGEKVRVTKVDKNHKIYVEQIKDK
jgi:membrane-bound ClpP family serine protease